MWILAKRPNLSADQLLRLSAQQKKTFTIQAVYKELRSLQQEGVIYKQGQRYSISLSWIINLLEQGEQMLATYSAQKAEQSLLPGAGEKITFIFSKLSHVDDFWINILFVMLKQSEKRILYQWLPHPWFHLIHSHKSWPLHKALKRAGYKVLSIIGDTTFLDENSRKITTKGAYEFYYGRGPFTESRANYFSVTDRYLFTLKLDAGTVRRLDELYSSVKAFSDFSVDKVMRAVDTPGRYVVTLENGTKQMAKVLKRFLTYF